VKSSFSKIFTSRIGIQIRKVIGWIIFIQQMKN